MRVLTVTFVLSLLLAGASVDHLHSLGVRLELSDVEHAFPFVDGTIIARPAAKVKGLQPPCSLAQRPAPLVHPYYFTKQRETEGGIPFAFSAALT